MLKYAKKYTNNMIKYANIRIQNMLRYVKKYAKIW